MQQVIVPLDFSQTSLNAAHYACNLYKGRTDVNIILYHFYATAEDKTVSEQYLDTLKKELLTIVPHIDVYVESGDHFIDSLAAYAHVKAASMIIMGLTGKTPLAQRFSGTSTLKMAEKEICPVLIVPEEAKFEQLDNVLITSEMKAVDETPTLLTVKRVLQEFKPSLHVLNVDERHYIALTKEFKTERDKLETLLADFNPEFYFMRLYDFHEAVNLFAADKKIDMIIIAPKYHSFYERLFKTQHTKKMIYQSKVPVLAIHE
ncbi:MAG: universal stress protein [Bacteroidetes bacterium]|nr:universal stress protein [Bacteroidota bacterium]